MKNRIKFESLYDKWEILWSDIKTSKIGIIIVEIKCSLFGHDFSTVYGYYNVGKDTMETENICSRCHTCEHGFQKIDGKEGRC